MAQAHVVVSGPMGVGKSTLCQALARELRWACELESDGSGNPFLADAYRDPARWGFHSQAFFLTEALAQQAVIARRAGGVVQDRHLDEHLAMFAAPLRERGHISDREFGVLTGLVDAGKLAVGSPDLLVYAHARPEVILGRIRSRGRDYEQHLTAEHVAEQCARYERFVADWRDCPVLRVDVSEVDVRTDAGRDAVVGRVRDRLGLS